ncbi:MAG: NHL repeat-containing protein [SAR202 cluster bacterium]|nr:NHL repeat-containing protein [SAR202 cluster bacterium]
MNTTSVAGRTWHFSHALGRPSAEHNDKTGGYNCPIDVAATSDDILFVLSRGVGVNVLGYQRDAGRRIGKTTLAEEHIGDFARTHFVWPTGLDISGDGNVFVSDEHTNQILIFPPDRIQPYPEFNPEGEQIGQWGEAGPDEGQLSGPSGIEFDTDGNLFIVNSGNGRIQKFTKDGKFLLGWGSTGNGESEFSRPWGICFDRDGNVYVADWGNHRVQKFTADGKYIMSFGTSHDEGGDLNHPSGVAVDSDGDVYVTDWGHRRVVIFEPNGDVITSLYGDAQELSKAGEYIIRRDPGTIKAYRQVKDKSELGRFLRPVGIAVDGEDRVIITDTAGRLQVYAKDHNYVEPEFKLEIAP